MLWLSFLAVFHTVFLRSDATATVYFAAGFVQLLFEGSYLRVAFIFLESPETYINDGWIGHVQV